MRIYNIIINIIIIILILTGYVLFGIYSEPYWILISVLGTLWLRIRRLENIINGLSDKDVGDI